MLTQFLAGHLKDLRISRAKSKPFTREENRVSEANTNV